VGFQFVAGFGVSALTGCTGKVGVVSSVSQYSRSLFSALKHVGKHSGGIGGCLAYPGSGGICADLTSKFGGGAGGVAQADSNNSTSSTVSGASRMNSGDFLGM
jgi:hypothetical protein